MVCFSVTNVGMDILGNMNDVSYCVKCCATALSYNRWNVVESWSRFIKFLFDLMRLTKRANSQLMYHSLIVVRSVQW